MNRRFIYAYILFILSTFLFVASLLRCDSKIKFTYEVASRKLEVARVTKDEDDIKEADELINNVINDNKKEELKKELNIIIIEKEKDNLRKKYSEIFTELNNTLNESKYNEVKKEVESLKYDDVKEEFNKELKVIEDKINKKKEEQRKKEEEARRKQAAQNALINADKTIPKTVVPSNVRVLESFKGTISAYSDNHTASGRSTAGGNIFYPDKTFGQVYIVAADPSYPFGTIVRFRNLSYFGRDIYAIVLDRGGMIKKGFRDFDLLFALKSNTSKFGLRRNVTCEILRKGY